MATLIGTPNNDTLIGTIENDIIRGLGGDDSLVGLAGSDRLDGGTGADHMDGGDGRDFYTVDNLGDLIYDINATDPLNTTVGTSIDTTVSFNLATGIVGGGISRINLALRASNIVGTGSSGNDLIISYSPNTTLIGGGGADILKGGTGSVVRGGAGNDVLEITNGNTGALIGGAGDDTYNVFSTSGSLSINETADGGSGVDTVFSLVDFNLNSQAGVVFSGAIENLTLAVLDINPGDKLGGPISGTGNNLNNVIVGNRQDNILSGNNGADTIFGSFGNDTINGGAGNDTLQGNQGDDTLNGASGIDELIGGIGNDTYYVDNFNDVVVEASGEGIDTVFTSATWNNLNFPAEVEFITVIGTNPVNVGVTSSVGTSVNVVISNSATNTFTGGTGDDTLNGGAGIDNLTGGPGADTFAFGGAGLSVAGSTPTSIRQDTVMDFDSASGDKIQLDSASFTLLTGPTLTSFAFGNFGSTNAGIAITGADIVYNTFNGFLAYDTNGINPGLGVNGGFFATLSGAPSLTAADFVIV